jgi:molecular chaperone GrpE
MTDDELRNQAKEDRRRGLAPGDETAPAPDDAQSAPPSASGADEATLGDQLARLLAEKEELTQTLVRRQADFDNYRKRVERERKEEGRRGAGRLLQDLLPVVDAFERALRSHDSPADDEYRKGMELIYRQLWDILAKHGLERIATGGKKFDPHFHEAIERVETREYPDGTIIDVLQEGYLFDGRVLRPSLVRVAVETEGEGGDRSSAAHHRAFDT